jgi:diacylglycerol kinase family enzyme
VPARRHRGIEHREGARGVIRPGEEWGTPARGPADIDVTGGDPDLAAAVAARPGVLVRFHPAAGSALAGAVGIGVTAATDPDVEVALDLLRFDDTEAAVNMIVLGTPPERLRRLTRRFGANVRIDDRSVFHGPCTTVVVATGQFRHGLDVVPRGHPGDGRAEVQIYAVRGSERAGLRTRLATGTHVPHPGITQRTARRVTVSTGRNVAFEVDGRPRPATDFVEITVVRGAYRLLL